MKPPVAGSDEGADFAGDEHDESAGQGRAAASQASLRPAGRNEASPTPGLPSRGAAGRPRLTWRPQDPR